MVEQKCYDFLVDILHPQGVHCPNCQRPVEASRVLMRDRTLLLYLRCPCGRIYNTFTGTVWEDTHHRCSVIVRILQGFAHGSPTLHLAKELSIDRKHLLERRNELQDFAAEAFTPSRKHQPYKQTRRVLLICVLSIKISSAPSGNDDASNARQLVITLLKTSWSFTGKAPTSRICVRAAGWSELCFFVDTIPDLVVFGSILS